MHRNGEGLQNPEKPSVSEPVAIMLKKATKLAWHSNKFRGILRVKLFEVFWQQVVELIKVNFRASLAGVAAHLVPQARPDVPIQDITALLVSLTNLSSELLSRSAGLRRPDPRVRLRQGEGFSER